MASQRSKKGRNNKKARNNMIINKHIDIATDHAIYKFINMIENYASESINKVAIVTFYDRTGWLQTYDVEWKESGCIWGYNEAHKLSILAKLHNPDRYPVTVVVRTFNEQKFMVKLEDNRETEIPGKDIRMYIIKDCDNILKLSPEECFKCYNTDSETGQPLDLDPTVNYR